MSNVDTTNPLRALPVITSTTVSTTAAIVTSTAKGQDRRRITICNKSSSAVMAYTWVAQGGSTTITASALGSGASTDGIPIFPQSCVVVNLMGGQDLYVVASASSTPFTVAEVING